MIFNFVVPPRLHRWLRHVNYANDLYPVEYSANCNSYGRGHGGRFYCAAFGTGRGATTSSDRPDRDLRILACSYSCRSSHLGTGAKRSLGHGSGKRLYHLDRLCLACSLGFWLGNEAGLVSQSAGQSTLARRHAGSGRNLAGLWVGSATKRMIAAEDQVHGTEPNSPKTHD